MKVEIKNLPKSEVELTITVPFETYKKWEKKALEDIGKEIKVEGFRPGNVPEDIVRKKVDAKTIKGATLDYVFPQTYSKAAQEHDLKVIAQPKVEIKKDIEKDGDDFVYTATVAIMPEVKVGNYKKIKVSKKPVKVEQKSIDESIELLMGRFAEWNDVEGEAKLEDRAECDFEGFDEGGAAITSTASKNHPIILGSKTMIPGFEDAILGMKKGETKEFNIDFPKDYHAKNMQGKKVKFKITVNRIEEKKSQTLNDSMVAKITGKSQTVDDFKKMVEKNLQAEIEQKAKAEHENAIVSEIIKITKAELPDAMIEQELDMMMNEQKQRITQQGMQWDKYMEHIKKTEEDFKKDFSKGAEERIYARLGVHHIIQDAKIETDDAEVNTKIEEMIAKYPKEQGQQIRDHYLKDPQAFRGFKYNLSADKLFKMLTK